MDDTLFLENGSVTSVPGFRAAGVVAGFKRSGAPDFALLVSDEPAAVSGVFTRCLFAAAPVLYDRELVRRKAKLRAVAVNSGIANACTGAQGLEAARKSCEAVADVLKISPEEVAVASTGRIGVQLPVDMIRHGVELAAPALSADGGPDAARAIMTTDTEPKHTAIRFRIGGKTVTIGAMTKGAGMINPDLVGLHATMLCFITTDACADQGLFQNMLEANARDSFNRITVDGDMSTNDTVMLLANGKSGVRLAPGTPEAAQFQEALLAVMQKLARAMVKDGEGSTKLVTIEVNGAANDNDARLAAEAVANSLLCKTAWFGNDPNWGRVVAALGYSGAKFDPARCNVWYEGIIVVRDGGDAGTPEEDLVPAVSKPEFTIRCDLGAGSASYWVWSSDISYEYVKINADYHT